MMLTSSWILVSLMISMTLIVVCSVISKKGKKQLSKNNTIWMWIWS